MKPELLKDEKYPEMYRVGWPDGKISDMVNKTRTKDAIRRWLEYARRFPNNKPEEASRKARGAFK